MSVIDLPAAEAAHQAQQAQLTQGSSQMDSLRVSMCFEMYMHMCANSVKDISAMPDTTCRRLTELSLKAVDTFVEGIS